MERARMTADAFSLTGCDIDTPANRRRDQTSGGVAAQSSTARSVSDFR